MAQARSPCGRLDCRESRALLDCPGAWRSARRRRSAPCTAIPSWISLARRRLRLALPQPRRRSATAGIRWSAWGDGDITYNFDGSETIDGLTSFIGYPGSVRWIVCDGTALYSIPLVGGTKTFSSTGNYVWAPGIAQWAFDLMGAGAGVAVALAPRHATTVVVEGREEHPKVHSGANR